MELPALTLPEIELPFDIPLLMHPPVDHFIIALPVIILLLEVANLIVKKRAIGITSFFLLILTVVAAIAAYFTGSVDGKEAFPLLSEAAQGELKEHKLLGTYLMLFSVIVLVFKILSALISKGLMKALYLLVLILFVAGILKQGKDGGELVYTFGVNVEKVQELDDELFDAKEELEELQESYNAAQQEALEKEAAPAVKPEETPTESAPATTEVKETPSEAVETVTPSKSVVESVESEVSEGAQAVEEKAEEIKVEVIPQEIKRPKIDTH